MAVTKRFKSQVQMEIIARVSPATIMVTVEVVATAEVVEATGTEDTAIETEAETVAMTIGEVAIEVTAAGTIEVDRDVIEVTSDANVIKTQYV